MFPFFETANLTTKDIMQLNVPRIVVFEGSLVGLSFLLNLYLFAMMEEGPLTVRIIAITVVAVFLVLIPYTIEMWKLVFIQDNEDKNLRPLSSNPFNVNDAASSPTSLPVQWKIAFLFIGSISPLSLFAYLVKGYQWLELLAAATLTTSAGSMLLFFFSSLDASNPSEGRRSLFLLGLWATSVDIFASIGNLNERTSFVVLCISFIFWLNPPLLYFLRRLRNILSQMSPPDISTYLSTNILTIGISFITPMIYFSMGTLKCLSKLDVRLSEERRTAGAKRHQQHQTAYLCAPPSYCIVQ